MGGQYASVVIDHRKKVVDALKTRNFMMFPDAFASLAYVRRIEGRGINFELFDVLDSDDLFADLNYLPLLWWVYDFNGEKWAKHPELGFDNLPDFLYTEIQLMEGFKRLDLDEPKKVRDTMFMSAMLPL